ncbi:MAG: transcriptional regulator [Rhodospirillaceae bacterium]|nr:MAG: transcriptional regulator [Rhodospirillaceae bacterium]
MTKALKTFKAQLLAKKGVRKAYEELVPEYAVARAVIKARNDCGLTQAQLAKRMNTSQSYIARLENGTVLPTMKTFLRVAKATDTRAKFELEPV